MTNDLHIRTATRADLPALLLLYDQLHPDGPALSMQDATVILDRFLRYDGSAVLLGFKDEALVTSCSLVVVPNLTRGGAPYALIENVITDAKSRKRGYGQAILQEAVSVAWQSGCYKVMLLTGSKDRGTLRFYERAGFEQSKTGFQVRRLPVRET
ncbi:GNAT family N-acetyltransferase [Mesorhizobium sp. BAC0120]|uniref:GNAT family N-acetyltransferase n=1 Tax=Mesorhizobium sp. BAC0120 TaxID=3090670 RepID=UPI00298CDB23|nr:GNAT family N-acetyltransferase [Mesorhizobium sp. BAC0120]MDW6020786.1 GNAT family N-acetyltransferase [Mesorhizobium sp. BAC0120]